MDETMIEYFIIVLSESVNKIWISIVSHHSCQEFYSVKIDEIKNTFQYFPTWLIRLINCASDWILFDKNMDNNIKSIWMIKTNMFFSMLKSLVTLGHFLQNIQKTQTNLAFVALLTKPFISKTNTTYIVP